MSLRHAILGFIDLEPTTGYTLAQRFSGSVGSFWAATQSQIYRELHDLEQAGHVKVDVVHQPGKPSRKVYEATASGRAELRHWLAGPLEPVQLRDPFLLKFVFAAESEPSALDAQLVHYKEMLEQTRKEYRARLVMPEIFSLARSAREAALWRLSLENGLAWCEAQLRWVTRARQQLSQTKPDKRPRRRKKSA